MALGASIIMDFLALEPTTVWNLLQRSHPDLLSGDRKCWCGGTQCCLDDIATVIRQLGKPHFGIAFEENALSDLSYGHVGNCSLSRIDLDGVLVDVKDSERWIGQFVSLAQFRQAWVFDEEYDHWQNAHDPLEYKAVRRSYAGLPMKSNGLPFPLEQRIIDTSQNPGRCVLRDGYVEAVGSVMWLGGQFWPLTGASKQAVLSADWLQCEQLPNGVLRIQAADTPFITAEGSSGELQDKLRSLLFPRS